jgi:hypothetical protein
MICDSNTYVSYSQFLEQVKWVFSRLQSYLPLAAGVYTLTAVIVFYNYNVRDWYLSMLPLSPVFRIEEMILKFY